MAEQVTRDKAAAIMGILRNSIPDLILCGAFRRGHSTDTGISLVACCEYEELERTLALQSDYPIRKRVPIQDSLFMFEDHAYMLHVLRCEPHNKGAAVLEMTGNGDFLNYLRYLAKQRGLLLNSRGIWHRRSSTLYAAETEDDIFDTLCHPYVEPEDREAGRWKQLPR